MLNKFKKFASEQKPGFCDYEWSSRIVVRRRQTFAIFGDFAYDVSRQSFEGLDGPGTHRGEGKICVPVNGRYFLESPDEGSTGIMGCYVLHRRGKTIITDPSFVPCGWLYTSEINLTNNEIFQNMIDEIADGENVFTQKPAGWA